MIYNNKTSPFFLIICLYYIAYLILPVISFLFTINIQIAFTMFIIIYIVNNKYSTKSLNFFIPFSLILILELLSYLVNENGLIDILIAIYKAILFALPAFLAFYLIVNNFRKTILTIVILAIIFLFITSITSIYGLFTDADAARLISMGNLSENIIAKYNRLNIGGFGIVYMIPIVFPMLIAVYSKRKINIIIFLFIVITFAFYVFLSQFSMAILFSLISLVSIIIAHNYSFKKLIVFVIICFIVFFFSKPIIGNALYLIASTNVSETVSIRMNALGDALLGINNNVDAFDQRVDMYKISIDAILSSPLFGVFYKAEKIGGHSFILDRLGLFGIFGLIAIILFYRQIYKFLYEPFRRESYYGYMVWSLFLSIILAFVNPTSNVFIICLMIPLIAYLLQDKIYIVKNKKGELIEIKK